MVSRSKPFESDRHDASSFDCGTAELDNWIKNGAALANSMRSAAIFVWVKDTKVCGYYALAPHSVAVHDVPPKIGHGSRERIPAYLLAKLALDKSLHGQGFGGALLLDALTRIRMVTKHAAARIVVADPIDESAVEFYRRFGFVGPVSHGGPMVIKMSAVERMIDSSRTSGGAQWPATP